MKNKEKIISLIKNSYLIIFNVNFILFLSKDLLNINKYTNMVFEILLKPLDLFLNIIYNSFNEKIGVFVVFILWGINELLLFNKLKLLKTKKIKYYLFYILFILTAILFVVSIMWYFILSDLDFNFKYNN